MRRARPFITRLLLCAALATAAGCGDEALFDEMAENRLQVVIKGTFESNNPRPWGAIPADDSVNTLYLTSEPDPNVFMMDFAEAKLDHEYFSNYRQTYSAGLNDVDPFFSGVGIPYEVDDVKDGSYLFVRFYIRKMLMDSAKQYIESYFGSWDYYMDMFDTFDEETVFGFDFNQLQTNTYYDSMRKEASDVNRVFPLVVLIDDGGLHYNRKYPTVLEVRFVLKNFIKKYEFDTYYTYNDSYWHMVYHYYAVSDWLRDVKPEDSVIGGNLIPVARAYTPGYTATISGTTTNAGYVMAIPAEFDISNYLIPRASRVRPSYDDAAGTCYDMPKFPFLPAAFGIESQLDYYLKMDQYNSRYNSFVDAVNSLQYAARWEDYFIKTTMFRVPPLVTWAPGGGASYQLTNVPMGRTYKLYFARQNVAGDPDDPGVILDGELPDLEDVTNPVAPLIVTVNSDMPGQNF